MSHRIVILHLQWSKVRLPAVVYYYRVDPRTSLVRPQIDGLDVGGAIYETSH
jgi:hypothetical protein